VTVPELLFNTLQEEAPTEWTEFEIKEHIDAGGEFDSGRIRRILRNIQNQPPSALVTPTIPILGSLANLITLMTTHPTTTANIPMATATATIPMATAMPTTPAHSQALIQQPASTTSQSFGKELANLAKLYTEESKYTGQDDNFDFKLVIFYNLCGRVDVPNRAMAKAYPTMLSSLALDHYYTNIRNTAQTLPFY
jgi:hypothetical protein